MEPRVSVIIPYYNGDAFIADTLGSLFAQNYPNLEIIVVNDGSIEESLAALKPFEGKIKLIHQRNQGQSAGRNTGLEHATGEFICFLDHDDLWKENFLSLMLPILTSKEKECDYVIGMTQFFRINDEGARELQEPRFYPILLGSILIKKDIANLVGPFDPALRVGEDLDWNLRLKEITKKEGRINEVVFLYHKHDSNQSSAANYVKDGQFSSIRRKLMRLRVEQK